MRLKLTDTQNGKEYNSNEEFMKDFFDLENHPSDFYNICLDLDGNILIIRGIYYDNKPGERNKLVEEHTVKTLKNNDNRWKVEVVE